MPGHKRSVPARIVAVAVPFGVAAAFACLAPAASAAPQEGARSAVIADHPDHSARPDLSVRHAPLSSHRHARRLPRRLRAYHWALTQRGHPYVYGGTGPGYDCSGLVMMAYRHAGIHLPRTTYEMLGSKLLVRVSHPVKGDLAFYGSGHVELFVKRGYTYGAHDYGSPVSRIHYGWGWVPTAFYRVR